MELIYLMVLVAIFGGSSSQVYSYIRLYSPVQQMYETPYPTYQSLMQGSPFPSRYNNYQIPSSPPAQNIFFPTILHFSQVNIVQPDRDQPQNPFHQHNHYRHFPVQETMRSDNRATGYNTQDEPLSQLTRLFSQLTPLMFTPLTEQLKYQAEIQRGPQIPYYNSENDASHEKIPSLYPQWAQAFFEDTQRQQTQADPSRELNLISFPIDNLQDQQIKLPSDEQEHYKRMSNFDKLIASVAEEQIIANKMSLSPNSQEEQFQSKSEEQLNQQPEIQALKKAPSEDENSQEELSQPEPEQHLEHQQDIETTQKGQSGDNLQEMEQSELQTKEDNIQRELNYLGINFSLYNVLGIDGLRKDNSQWEVKMLDSEKEKHSQLPSDSFQEDNSKEEQPQSDEHSESQSSENSLTGILPPNYSQDNLWEQMFSTPNEKQLHRSVSEEMENPIKKLQEHISQEEIVTTNMPLSSDSQEEQIQSNSEELSSEEEQSQPEDFLAYLLALQRSLTKKSVEHQPEIDALLDDYMGGSRDYDPFSENESDDDDGHPTNPSIGDDSDYEYFI